MATCRYCESEIGDAARKCRYCGEWVQGPPHLVPPLPSPASPLPLPPSHVNVTVQQESSVLFAVITLVCYFFLYPAAFILNLVGLFTGPQRGCFWGMFLVFVVLPVVLILGLIVAGIPIVAIAMEFLDDFR